MYTTVKRTAVKPIRPSQRHPMLLYRRMMDRLWPPTLILGGLLAVAGSWGFFSPATLLPSQGETWLLASAALLLAIAGSAWLARSLAYVRLYPNHMRLVTPFLQLRLSYRRIVKASPADFIQLFPPRETRWAQRRFLEPFYGQTAVVVELNRYPISPALLRLFFPAQMFSPRKPGFVLLVPDWMEFSSDLETRRGAWMQANAQKKRSMIAENSNQFPH